MRRKDQYNMRASRYIESPSAPVGMQPKVADSMFVIAEYDYAETTL